MNKPTKPNPSTSKPGQLGIPRVRHTKRPSNSVRNVNCKSRKQVNSNWSTRKYFNQPIRTGHIAEDGSIVYDDEQE